MINEQLRNRLKDFGLNVLASIIAGVLLLFFTGDGCTEVISSFQASVDISWTVNMVAR